MTDATTELTTFTPDNPVAVLTNPQQFDALLDRIRLHCDVDEPAARRIVLAIVAGTIPNIAVRF